jgi:hypothetical protein
MDEQEEEKELVLGGAEILKNMVIHSTPVTQHHARQESLQKQFTLMAPPSFEHRVN